MATMQPSSKSVEEAKNQNINNRLNNLLIVTGNGFDLACDLPTRYCDFFKSLIDKNFGVNNAQFCDILDSGDYALIHDKLVLATSFTIWEYYLYYEYRKTREPEKLLWFDIEEELTDFFRDNGFWDKAKQYIDDVKTNTNDVRYTVQRPTEWDIYSVAIYELFLKYKNNREFVFYDDVHDGVKCENFYTALEYELEKLEQKFKDYLNSLADFNDETYGKKRDELFDKIVSSVEKEIGKCSNPVICTFNYTNTTSKSKYDIQYVHGDKDHPIFGIDDSIVDTKKELNVFTKKYKRDNPLDKNVKRQTYTDILGESENVKYNIVFYGLSFARTDDYDFDFFLDYFDPNKTKIFLCASDEKYLNDMKTNFRRVFEKKFPDLNYDKLRQKNKIRLVNINEN